MLFLAAVSDVKTGRISNRLVLTGFCVGLFYRIWEEGPAGIIIFFVHATIPVFVLFLLFLMRVLGAGDIKLFSIISGICSFGECTGCIAAAFVIGAILAAVKMVYSGNFGYRIICFGIYIRTILMERSFYPYPFREKGGESTIHFSVAILLGYLVSLEVCR